MFYNPSSGDPFQSGTLEREYTHWLRENREDSGSRALELRQDLVMNAHTTEEIEKLILWLDRKDCLCPGPGLSGMVPTRRGPVSYHQIADGACVVGNLPLLRYLVEDRGMEVDAVIEGCILLPDGTAGGLRGTPLCFAAAHGHPEMTAWLLAQGATADVPCNGTGNFLSGLLIEQMPVTPLLCALLCGCETTAALLYAAGARFDPESAAVAELKWQWAPGRWQGLLEHAKNAKVTAISPPLC
ncbi:MAG: ankyrin repeat domain-containing protein [Oscillospiraceae bacterium]